MPCRFCRVSAFYFSSQFFADGECGYNKKALFTKMERGRYYYKLNLCTSSNALPSNGGNPYTPTRFLSECLLRADCLRLLLLPRTKRQLSEKAHSAHSGFPHPSTHLSVFTRRLYTPKQNLSRGISLFYDYLCSKWGLGQLTRRRPQTAKSPCPNFSLYNRTNHRFPNNSCLIPLDTT